LLESVSHTSLYKGIKESHPGNPAPVSLKTYLSMDEFLDAVRTNDITRILLRRSAPEVKTAKTVQAKFVCREDLQPMVAWHMEWIRTEREENESPNLNSMHEAWESAWARDPTNALWLM
jgi:hypothetical protein